MENISNILNNITLLEKKLKEEEIEEIKAKPNKSLLLTFYRNTHSKNSISKNKQNDSSSCGREKFKITQEKRKKSMKSPDSKITQNHNHKINFNVVENKKTINNINSNNNISSHNTTIITTNINITNNITNIKNNSNKNESAEEESKSNNIGILDVAFGNYARNEIKKKFKEDREREKNIKNSKMEVENNIKDVSVEINNFDEKNSNDKYNNINYIDEENKNIIEAINVKNSEEIENSKNNLILKESGIVFDADYNIFDMENIIDEDDNNDNNNNEYNDYNSFNSISNKYENEVNNEINNEINNEVNNEINNEINNENNNEVNNEINNEINKENNNKINNEINYDNEIDNKKTIKIKSKNNNENNINNINKENDIKNKETEIKIEIKEPQIENNNLKFLIPLEDDIAVSNKSSTKKTIIDNKDNKENNKNNKNINMQKVNKKVILDDESEEDVFFPEDRKKIIAKQTKNKPFNTSVITNEGRKFTLCLGNNNNNIQKKNKNESIFLNQFNEILLKMNQEINKENPHIILNKCFKIIADIKNENELKLKNIFLRTLNIFQYIFNLLGDTPSATKYISYLINLLELTSNFHKTLKKNYRDFENLPFYQIKKVSFNYIYSLLLLRTYNNDFLKTLKNEKNNENLLKFAKIYKKYTKSSEFLYKEIKNFKEKFNLIKNSSNLKLRYDSCLAHIQMSPNLMSYKKIFKHSAIILGFYTDYKNVKNEIINNKNKNGYKEKIKERERSRDKSVDRSKLRNGHK